MTKNTHFVRRFIENATISDTFKLQIYPFFFMFLTHVKNVISGYNLNIPQDIHVQKIKVKK